MVVVVDTRCEHPRVCGIARLGQHVLAGGLGATVTASGWTGAAERVRNNRGSRQVGYHRCCVGVDKRDLLRALVTMSAAVVLVRRSWTRQPSHFAKRMTSRLSSLTQWCQATL